MLHPCVRFTLVTAFFGIQLLHPQPPVRFEVPCEPTAETQKILDSLPAVRELNLPFETRVGPRRKLAAQYPDDFFLQRAYQESFRRSFYLAAEYDRALAMYRQRPDHPLSRYLEARLLMMPQPSRSKATFEELLTTYPDFVWPHLDFIEYLNLPGHRDPAEYEKRIKSFQARCPGAVEAYQLPPLSEDAAFRRSLAQNLRRTLELRNSPRDLLYWNRLWSFERELPTIRERVRADWKRIASLPFDGSLEWTSLYMTASTVLKEPALLKEYEARLTAQAPRSYALSQLLQSNWYRDNPYPQSNPTREAQQEYEAKRKEMFQMLSKRWPNDCTLSTHIRLDLSMRQHQDENFQLTPKDLEVISRAIRCKAEVPDATFSVPPLETMLAEVYVAAKTRLDQVPGLLKAGFQAYETNEKYRISSELTPAEMRGHTYAASDFMPNRTRQIQADYFLATGRIAEARDLIEDAIRKIDAASTADTQGPPGPAGPDLAQRRQFDRGMWVRRLAEVHVKEGKIDAALDLFRTTLSTISRQALAERKDFYVSRVRRLYVEKHGSEEGWVEWASAGKAAQTQPLPARPVTFSQPLPSFSAKDLTGREWSLSDLQGKATFVNYWATWCGPCRAEHPQLQKLHDLLKQRKDIQVLTISVDDSPAAAASYAKENNYTFPVLHGSALADKLLPWALLPSNFLVNAAGVRSGLYRYWSGGTWIDQVIADLEKAAGK
ncbi:MAG: TlpA family protein disulfide reductase [Bryobacterales bacterium]|nr:TlpA family protein disulfide reductase [Bryobacterales bacterium]